MEAFLTVREALKKAKKAAVGQVVLSNKERLVCLRPCSTGLIMETLRYAYEVREAKKYFEEIPAEASINQEQLELAELLIEQKTKPFDPRAFKDHYQEGLLEIIDAKLKGREVAKATVAGKTENVVDIMEALKRSLEQTKEELGSKDKGKGKKKGKGQEAA